MYAIIILLLLFLWYYSHNRSFIEVTMLQPDRNSMIDKLKEDLASTIKQSDEDTYISDILGEEKSKNDVMYLDLDLSNIKYKETPISIRRNYIREYYVDLEIGKVILYTSSDNHIIVKENLNLVKRKLFSIFA